MTEEEKRELRALKVAKVEDLRGWVKKRTRKIKAVWATDERLKTYVMEVARCPERHNVWEICAVVRFFELLEKYEWHEKRAKLQINMQERLRHRTDDGLREIRLQPVQAFMVAVPFGIVRKVDVRGKHGERRRAVRRVIRSVVWMVPRKFGKTTIISGFGVTEFFFGPYDAEVDVVSTTGRQAKICYNMIKLSMMDLVSREPSLQGVRLMYNRESLFYENPLDGAAQVNVFGDNPDALNGLKPSLAIEDESASMEDTPSKAGNESRNTLESGQGPREEPLSFQITTASKYVNGPFAQSLIGIKDVLAGRSQNDAMFAMLFCPDVDDREDDPATWHKCHPMLGETVQADYYEMNAKRILTIWGPPVNDYACRIWSGLIRDFYLPRLNSYYQSVKEGQPFDVAQWESNWVEHSCGLSPTTQPTDRVRAALSLMDLAKKVPVHGISTVQTEVLGQWDPSMLSNEWQEVQWTIPVAELQGLRGFTFRWQHGSEKLEISKVSIDIDGKTVATEEHYGETGIRNKGNDYRLTLPQSLGDGNVTLRATVRTTGNRQSYGQVLMVNKN